MRYHNQTPGPPQVTPLDAEGQWRYSKLRQDDRAPQPICKLEPGHSMKEDHFGHLYPRSHSHYLNLIGSERTDQ